MLNEGPTCLKGAVPVFGFRPIFLAGSGQRADFFWITFASLVWKQIAIIYIYYYYTQPNPLGE